VTVSPGGRLGPDSCARGFVRAAQYFANILTGADVLVEGRELIRGAFASDFVCFCRRSPDVGDCGGECGLPARGRETLRRAVDQVIDTGFMAMESFGPPSALACVVLPITVRGRTEAALLIGYAGEVALPPHALETLLGVAGLVGATLARQRSDRELVALAEERAARALAEEAIRVRDEFLAIASHELKTPLTALLLLVDGTERAIRKLSNPPALMLTKVAAIARQGRRLNRLVSDLLDVARIQSGRLHVSIEQVDLCAVAREVVARHQTEASAASCALEVVTDDPVSGAWDGSRVDQVLSNLLSNAIKYGAGKPVSVVVESDGRTARLSVKDNGIGIAPEDCERIFRRFERAVGADAFTGMGLGLWIVQEIVARLGGSIRVESQLGAGARFTVTLPLGPAPGAQAAS
jgi:signal transduction histidine kinase